MKKVKIIFKIIIFFSLYLGVQHLVRFAILNDTGTISRVMIHEIYNQEKNIDVLFCGASHCQLGINPEIMDEELGLNTFNAGSSSQGLESTLALIKEVSHFNDLSQVYVDLDYSIVMRDTPNLESIYIISDYLHPSFRKFDFLLNATPFDYYVNSFMPIHKGRGYIKNINEIPTNISKKLSRGYLCYEEVDSSYAGKGYIASRTVVEENDPVFTDVYEEVSGTIPDTSIKYIQEIIDFCKKKNIKLTFISIPITEYRARRMKNYDSFIGAIKNLLSKDGIEYYDFNLYRPETLPLNDLKYYNDDNHLNVAGSTLFANIFSSFVNGKISEEELFFDSLSEKYGM